MRLFVGLPFPHQARRDFLLIQKGLQRGAVKGNFTAVGNFHLTLSFLGEVEEARLPAVFAALEAAPLGPVSLSFQQLRRFEGGIWYLAPDPSPTQHQGKAQLAQALVAHGFSPERQVYVPHVTLGRKVLFPEGHAPPKSLLRPIQARSEGARLFLSHRVDGQLRYDILQP